MTDQDRIEYFKNEISRLSNQVVDLLNERDQLEAQVQELREDLARCRHQASYCIGGVEALQEQLSKIRLISNKALASTPAQCLAEIKAQAVEEILSHFDNKFRANEKLTVKNVCWMLNEHLKQLRQQAVKVGE